jgi:aminoglycoside phosphotransferase (APT) family kinase protein
MIPQEKTAAVTRALREAFGVTAFEDIRRLTKGQTPSLVFRIVVRGSPYLLKIIMLNYDPTRHFACMKAAAEAGLAPRVWYAGIEDRLFITDYVEATPLAVTDALVRIPAMLRALHALPPFPGVPNHINTSCMFLINKGPAVDAFIQRFQAANILPQGECEDLLARYAQLAAVYRRHEADMVSSHNDLFKPDNILFDGHRLWLVDWEAAFLNDRYADLAVVSNLVVTNDAEERVYLQEYFGRPPDPYQQARFFLMRQTVHLFYAVVFLLLGSAGEPVNPSENPPDFRDFHQRIWAGEVNLMRNDMRIAYGRVHRERLLQNMMHPRFDEAVRIVSDRHPCA